MITLHINWTFSQSVMLKWWLIVCARCNLTDCTLISCTFCLFSFSFYFSLFLLCTFVCTLCTMLIINILVKILLLLVMYEHYCTCFYMFFNYFVVNLLQVMINKDFHIILTLWLYRDGVTACDRYIALSNACDMITTQQEIDIFQIVCNVKQAQPHFFTQLVSRPLFIH